MSSPEPFADSLLKVTDGTLFKGAFSPDGDSFYFSSTSADWSETTIYKVDVVDGRLSGSRFEIETGKLANWRTDELYFWGATLSPRQDYWILEYSPLGEDGRPGPSDLYYSKRTGDRWGEPRPIAHGVNLPESTENFAISGPDGQELYFVRDFNSYYSISLHDALNQTRETAPDTPP